MREARNERVIDEHDPTAKELERRNLWAQFFTRSERMELFSVEHNNMLIETFKGDLDTCIDGMMAFLRSPQYTLQKEAKLEERRKELMGA